LRGECATFDRYSSNNVAANVHMSRMRAVVESHCITLIIPKNPQSRLTYNNPWGITVNNDFNDCLMRVFKKR
jgi:hypothetical protein